MRKRAILGEAGGASGEVFGAVNFRKKCRYFFVFILFIFLWGR